MRTSRALAPALAAALCSVAVAATPALGATGTTHTYVPGGDTYVSSGSPDSNYGTSSKLRATPSPSRTTYLRFTVKDLAEPVAKATLRLYATNSSSSGYAAYGVTSNSWGEKIGRAHV